MSSTRFKSADKERWVDEQGWKHVQFACEAQLEVHGFRSSFRSCRLSEESRSRSERSQCHLPFYSHPLLLRSLFVSLTLESTPLNHMKVPQSTDDGSLDTGK